MTGICPALPLIIASFRSVNFTTLSFVIEPDDNVAAIGSGGPYALAAARALTRHSTMDAETVARESLRIASEICVYTNDHITIEVL